MRVRVTGYSDCGATVFASESAGARRLAVERALIADYGNYAKRFEAIAEYLEKWQPPALMVWGRHDVYFELAEVLSWMRALPRMEAHILDAGHLLLETHAAAAAALMTAFIRRTQRVRSHSLSA